MFDDKKYVDRTKSLSLDAGAKPTEDLKYLATQEQILAAVKAAGFVTLNPHLVAEDCPVMIFGICEESPCRNYCAEIHINLETGFAALVCKDERLKQKLHELSQAIDQIIFGGQP